MHPIDLRSDTVTRPTPAMRRAMAEAEVGDDCYGEDPTVNRLERIAAEIMGKEAAMFVPSGTMGNATALLTHTRPGEVLLADAECHIYYYEQGGLAALAGLLPVLWESENGCPNPAWLREHLWRNPRMYPPVGLVALENTHNRRGGCVLTPEEIAAVHAITQEADVPLHLDGARIFNAAVALGITVREIAQHVDTLQFCLSKGLGAPVGSILAGPSAFIERARRARRRLGGAMRQAGVLAAAGLIALLEMPKRLHQDHENARLLAQRLAEIPELHLDPERVQTNIVVVRTERIGVRAEKIAARLRERGVLVTIYGPTTLRFVTHHDVSREAVQHAAEIAAQLFRELIGKQR